MQADVVKYVSQEGAEAVDSQSMGIVIITSVEIKFFFGVFRFMYCKRVRLSYGSR